MHTHVCFNVLIVHVEQDTPDPIAVVLCQAHTLKSSTRFLDGVDEVAARLGRCPFSLFDFPLRKIGAPLLGRDLVHDLLAVLEAARGRHVQVRGGNGRSRPWRRPSPP